jgi:large subunit ribosomal protein L4
MSLGAAIVKDRPAPATRQVVRRDVSGKELGTVELEPEIFGIEPNVAVLHQVVTAQMAAARSGTQSTRTRAEVRGGGAKPYRQKGTGRARQGSRTSPQWVGGGKALGPKPRSYRQSTPKKMVRLALRSALSDRAALERVALVDEFGWDAPKTKDAVAALAALEITQKVLVVLGPDDVVAERSFGNLPEVQTVTLTELCAHDVVHRHRHRHRHRRSRRRRRRSRRHRHGGRGLMRDAMSVLIRPVVSEKSYALMDRNVYVFIVDPRATKIDVRQAVERAFGVRVDKVNTLNRKGKATVNRRSNTKGQRPNTKRAIVTLHPGDKIDLFET